MRVDELGNTIAAKQVWMVVPSRSCSIIKPSDQFLAGFKMAGKDIFDFNGFTLEAHCAIGHGINSML